MHALIGAHALEAGERGVRISVDPDSLLLAPLIDVEDVAAVLGNLVDNAVRAAVEGHEPRHVQIGCFSDGHDLVLTVDDSGAGVRADIDLFVRSGRTAVDIDQVHGLGVGLPLSRELARRGGGDVWLISPGGTSAHTGAVFGARLRGVLGDARVDDSPDPGSAPRGIADRKDPTP